MYGCTRWMGVIDKLLDVIAISKDTAMSRRKKNDRCVISKTPQKAPKIYMWCLDGGVEQLRLILEIDGTRVEYIKSFQDLLLSPDTTIPETQVCCYHQLEIITKFTMLSPFFKSAVVGFITGSTVPLLVTTLYLVPQHQYSEQQELNWLKRVVGLLTWQVKKLEARQLGVNTAKLSEGYRDGLYWAGF